MAGGSARAAGAQFAEGASGWRVAGRPVKAISAISVGVGRASAGAPLDGGRRSAGVSSCRVCASRFVRRVPSDFYVLIGQKSDGNGRF